MGNQVCCDDMREENNPLEAIEIQKVVLTKQQGQQPTHHQLTPLQPQEQSKIEVSQGMKNTLQRQRFFEKEMEGIKVTLKHFGQDIYEGELDGEGVRPNGWGRIRKADGSCFVGEFVQGRAQGRGAFIFPDGSFFLGQFSNNSAHCNKGRFQSDSCRYMGAFKDNVFHGEGMEQGKNYSFQGEYCNGKRVEGRLKWTDHDEQFSYKGTFNEAEQFHGKGILEEKLGTYEGEFVNGEKEGQGEYRGKKGVRYVGGYRQDRKEGEGTIFNFDGSVAYQGEFKNGLPHGKDSGNKAVETIWEEGIDSRLLSKAKE